MKIIIFLFPIFLFIIFLFTKILLPDTYKEIIQEDSIIEYAQMLFYFLSSILSVIVSMKFFKRRLFIHGCLYCLLALGLFFVSLEEINWGQRLFNMTSPEYFKYHNTQKAISFHNLYGMQSLSHYAYIIIGAYGAFSWIFLRIIASKLEIKSNNVLYYIIPEWFLSSYFFFILFIYSLFWLLVFVIKPLPGGFIIWKDQEPVELLLSMGFFCFVAIHYIKLRKSKIQESI